MRMTRCSAIFAVVLSAWAAGCGDPPNGAIVYYLDGAGWYSGAGSVAQGLRDAGFKGHFKNYSWSAFLGPAHDHLVTAKSKQVSRGLAKEIAATIRRSPENKVYVMGLSAGTAVILAALEQLPDDVQVEDVVLFSPSVSSRHDLRRAMQRVRRNLYATCSRNDGILPGLVINADGVGGRPAGISGFVLPPGQAARATKSYRRVINLPWRPAYIGYDWTGGHAAVTQSRFVESVIAPRILGREPYPLNRSVTDERRARGAS